MTVETPWVNLSKIQKKPVILVIAPEWRDRAVLVAQLSEQFPYAVHSAPTPTEAELRLRIQNMEPVLLIVETDSSVDTSTLQKLCDTHPDTALVLIYGVFYQTEYLPFHARAAKVLKRPLTVGEIVRAVAAVLEDQNQS